MLDVLLLLTLFSPSFDYLETSGHRVTTTHHLRRTIVIDDAFRLLGETHHQPTFKNKQFNVSLAAFAKDDRFLMIHAESHTDGSGGLDYSNLEPVEIDGLTFHSRVQCAELERSDVDEEHELRFLARHGFDPSPAVRLRQYFATSTDGRSEIVITVGRRVGDCSGNEKVEEPLPFRIVRTKI